MISMIRLFSILALLAIGSTSFAAEESDSLKSSFSTDQSDLWWNPNESGWGMQIVQSDSILFATLFVYDSNNQPTFYGGTLTSVGNLLWTGDLYRTTGPYFGAGSFNPAQVGVRKVGTITFNVPFVQSGTVQYSVDGVAVTKAVQRQLLRYDNYNGGYVMAVNLTSSGCFNPTSDGAITGLMGIGITQNGQSMTIGWAFPDGTVCNHSGNFTQAGRMGSFHGTYACTSGEIGTMNFIEMTNRQKMMSARFVGQSTNAGCSYSGSFTGLIPN